MIRLRLTFPGHAAARAGTRSRRVVARAITAALTAALCGCSTGPHKPMSFDPDKAARTVAVEMTDVALDPYSRFRVEPYYAFGQSGAEVASGELWAMAFTGTPDTAMGVLRVTSSSLEQYFAALGFAVGTSYRVAAVLSIAGRDYPLVADGSNTGMFPPSTIRPAIKQAIERMARDVRALLTPPR